MKTLFCFALFITSLLSGYGNEPAWQPLWEKTAPGPAPATKEDKWIDNEHITRIATPSYQIWMPKEKSKELRPALCVFPGGGYGILAIKKEGERIARWAAENGMVGIVVKYRVSTEKEDGLEYPIPLIDGRRAIRLVRHNAKEWNIDPEKIGVIGFSAGGHLAATIATIWNKALPLESEDKIDAISCRPNFAMLIYPVISINKPYGHGGTADSLLGKQKDTPGLRDLVTPSVQVTKETPPLFLVHAANDGVSCLNSFDMARVAKETGIPVEFHLYTQGGHGFGMNQRGLDIDSWPDRAVDWLRTIKILPKSEKKSSPQK